MVRDLEMVERIGTQVRRKDGTGAIVVIKGFCKESALYPRSGFLVSDLENKDSLVILPFNRISEREVVFNS